MVFIIDGNHLACRCFYAVDLLTTSKGKPVNLIYGFISSLKTYVRRFGLKNNYFFITWDSKGKTSRHKIYSEYKGNRKGFSDEFYEQLNDVYEIVEALSIEQFKIVGIEADDIVGTLANRSRKKGQKVLIISADHDFEQLITKSVKILSPSLAISKEKIKDKDYVIKKYEIEPNRLVEVMSIVGDSGDNIIGVDGIGEKIAVRLLKANGNLNNVLNNADSLKILNKKGEIKEATDNIKRKIKENVKVIKLNRKLVEINCHLEVSPKFKVIKSIDKDKLKLLFEKFEFRKFINEIEKWEAVFTQ